MNRPMRLALAATACAALFAACSLDNQVMGVRGAPAGGAQFAVTANIGTSLSAGFQSGGINDSTQREGPMYQLALAMGLTPGVDWFYPSFAGYGCPAPLTNPLTGARVGGLPSPPNPASCQLRNPSSARPYMSDVAIPGLRAAQALDVTVVPFSSDTIGTLAQFITGSISPVTMVQRQHPTFVTIEVGANDVLAAATRGDTTFLTPTLAFTTQIGAIADSLATISPAPGVAIANIPNVTVIAHFTKGSTLYCLNTGACGFPAVAPFNSAGFSIAASCAPNAALGVGDNYLLTFGTTGAVVNSLAGGGSARINCGAVDSTTVKPNGAGAFVSAGATINTAEYATITGRVAAFNTAISALAATPARTFTGAWALVDLNATLAAQAANIPAIPNFANPTAPFACPAAGCPTGTVTVFSNDGVHPTKAGYRLMAQAFATAINARYGSTLVFP
jgi:lysophospholipase L1-like esterase